MGTSSYMDYYNGIYLIYNKYLLYLNLYTVKNIIETLKT
jgi:hypothetical protein